MVSSVTSALLPFLTVAQHEYLGQWPYITQIYPFNANRTSAE
jgi:hypothetical protein